MNPELFYGMVFGSLMASLCYSDTQWNLPRRPYHAILAGILLIGFVVRLVS